MKKPVHLPIPAIRALTKLGRDISCARRRRRITVELMAERANLSKNTVFKIEQGSPTVSMGGYAAVLFALGMIDRISDLADGTHDLTGQELAIESLPKRIRLPKGNK